MCDHTAQISHRDHRSTSHLNNRTLNQDRSSSGIASFEWEVLVVMRRNRGFEERVDEEERGEAEERDEEQRGGAGGGVRSVLLRMSRGLNIKIGLYI